MRIAGRLDPVFVARNARTIARVLLNDRRGPTDGHIGTTEQHLAETMTWLYRAQDQALGGGVSHSFNLLTGWEAPYPETTGYIIPTMWNWFRRSGEETARARAIAMAEWLVAIQHREGWWPGGLWTPERTGAPSVFNTGQVLFGMLRAFEETGDEQFREAGVRAGRWLRRVQDPDGAWRRFLYGGMVHAYEARVASACAAFHQHAPGEGFDELARRNLDFTSALQEEDGWWRQAGFTAGGPAFLHTLAYTMDGFLEAGHALAAPAYVERARLTADALLGLQRTDGWLAGHYHRAWLGAKYACLTGIAQTGVVWARLYGTTGEMQYIDAVERGNRYLMACQSAHASIPETRGALAGSRPCWGRYMPLRFPNWAAKFLADALMTELDARQTQTPSPPSDAHAVALRAGR